MSSHVAAGFHVSALTLAIVALSPVPLALPSGIAVAVIGLHGSDLGVAWPAAAPQPPSFVAAPLRKERHDVTVRGNRPRGGSWARA